MNPLSWQACDFAKLSEQIADDELLVVLTDPTGPVDSWSAALVEKSVPSEQHKHYNLTTHFGFLADGYRKPFVVAKWQAEGNSALERRWVLGNLGGRLKAQFNVKKLAVALPQKPRPEHAVMAEDLYCYRGNQFFDENHFESCRVLVAKGAETAAETTRDIRFHHHMEYRRWVNENPDIMTSLEIGRRLAAFAKKHQCQFKELGREELKEEKLNLLLAVGQASELSPSRLYVVTHNCKPGARPLMLVGKGITFDTGGINLKPHEGFVNCMKNDMGGAALSANLFMALVSAGYDKPLALLIPTCENLIGEKALKPGTIVPTRSGRKVFVEHTDAEGRLILADAISYGHDHFNPALTLVMATLTTASLRQFSNFFSAVHFANGRFEQDLREKAALWGEGFSFWQEFYPFKAANKTKAADLTNLGRMPQDANIGGGSNVAAHFLREFAKHPMIHFDIFATVWNWSGDYPGCTYGATGAPFNALFETIKGNKDVWGY